MVVVEAGELILRENTTRSVYKREGRWPGPLRVFTRVEGSIQGINPRRDIPIAISTNGLKGCSLATDSSMVDRAQRFHLPGYWRNGPDFGTGGQCEGDTGKAPLRVSTCRLLAHFPC